MTPSAPRLLGLAALLVSLISTTARGQDTTSLDSSSARTARSDSVSTRTAQSESVLPRTAQSDSVSRSARPDTGPRAVGPAADSIAAGGQARPDSLTLASGEGAARSDSVTSTPPAPPGPVAARVTGLVRQGDQAMARLEPTAALQAYQAAVSLDPSSYEALWKAGRTLIDLGELEQRGNSQKDKYNKALKYADRAVRVRPGGAEGHFVRAYALGRVSLFEGGKTKLRLAREIKVEALRAIDLDPLQDGAYHVLGDWNYDLAELNWVERTIGGLLLGGVPKDASFENAAHYYQLAIQINPEHIDHHLGYARTLIKLGRKEEARVELEKVRSLPVRDLDDPADKHDADQLLERVR
jgi:tetratricopeptide (TPR) repeat protein